MAVLACLKVLCPSADHALRRQLATGILALVHGEDRLIAQKTISDAALYEMFTRNNQCILNKTGS
jgi:hypothetical protein